MNPEMQKRPHAHLPGGVRPLQKNNTVEDLTPESPHVNWPLPDLGAAAFLRIVFALEEGEELPTGHHIGLTEKTSRGMERTPCANPELAAALVARIGKRACVFFETNTGPKVVQGGRLSAAEALSTGHLRLDLDLASPHRKSGKRHPATEGEALVILSPLLALLPVSLIVRTGYGLQSYWTFKEPVDLINERERMAYKRAAAHLLAFANSLMQRAGFSPLDNVNDLARVMRLPGSFNTKDPAHPRPVTYEDHGHRYGGPGDIHDALPEIELPSPDAKAPPAIITGHMSETIRAEAARKIKVVLDFEAEDEPKPARRTVTRAWHREPLRRDNSQSAHDWRLVKALAFCGLEWTGAELAAAIVLFREACATALAPHDPKFAHSIREKAQRSKSYLAPTVGKALAAAKGDK